MEYELLVFGGSLTGPRLVDIRLRQRRLAFP